LCLVEEFELNEEIEEKRYTIEITCPYCNNDPQDSWDYEDEGEIYCETCGGNYTYSREFKVSYTSHPLNREIEHKEY
jgi:hypothetical protein